MSEKGEGTKCMVCGGTDSVCAKAWEKERDALKARIDMDAEEHHAEREILRRELESMKAIAERLAGSLRICDHSGRCIDDVGLHGPTLCDRCEALSQFDGLKK